MHRGELYLADLDQQVGSEQSGLRPVVVVQNEIGNRYSPTTIICPITSKQKSKIPTHVFISPDDCDIMRESTILCEQVRVIDKTRLRRKLGQIDNRKIIAEVNKKLMISIGVIDEG